MLYYNSINNLQLHKDAGKQHSIVSDSFVLQQVLGPITNKATLAQPKANVVQHVSTTTVKLRAKISFFFIKLVGIQK